jgi:small subunit ribosomal protein S1
MELENRDPIQEDPENSPEIGDASPTVESVASSLDSPELGANNVEQAPIVPAESALAYENEEIPSAAENSGEEEESAPIAESALVHENEEVPSAAENSGEEEESAPLEDTTAAGVKRGTLIEGTVTEATAAQMLVDLGDGVVGVVSPREMDFLERKSEEYQPGDKLWVYVLRSNNENGQPVLSISRALEEQDWREAEQYADNKAVYEGRVAGYNKGGLIVRFGRLRGFIPASQISHEREQRAAGDNPDQRWSDMLNEVIMVKVVEVNRARNRLILSERAASREAREKQKERLINELRVGESRTGRVISLTDFGAFVDLGGADGLIHLTEMSWKHVNHPREVLSVGQEVDVKVISVDPERKRIGLSLKSLEQDPWDEVAKAYNIDQLVQGKITKLTRFGAFASLLDNADVEGLIHVSELADYRVEHPRDVVAVGDVLTLRVLKVDAERRRLGLSLKRVNSSRYMEADWQSWDPKVDE